MIPAKGVSAETDNPEFLSPNPTQDPLKVSPGTRQVIVNLKPGVSSEPSNSKSKVNQKGRVLDASKIPVYKPDQGKTSTKPSERTTKTSKSSAHMKQFPTVSLLASWVRRTHNASEIAKSGTAGYGDSNDVNGGKESISDESLFLKIRFPFLGEQEAPEGKETFMHEIIKTGK